MKQIKELRTYISAIAIVPILIMLLNQTVLLTFLGFFRSPYFLFALAMIIMYMVLFTRGSFNRMKNQETQLMVKNLIVNLPVLPAIVSIVVTRNIINFVPMLFAYLFFGVIACVYQIVVGTRVSALHRITFFFLGYILAMITYTGSIVGLQTGETFSLLHAFDNLNMIASAFGSLPRPIPLPLDIYIKIAMMLAIPAITFSALAAQVRQTEVRHSPTGEPRFVSSLRPAIALLTVVGVLAIFPVLFASRILAGSVPFLVTVLPPLGVALLVLLIVRITQTV